jgi:hypothetical protein
MQNGKLTDGRSEILSDSVYDFNGIYDVYRCLRVSVFYNKKPLKGEIWD